MSRNTPPDARATIIRVVRPFAIALPLWGIALAYLGYVFVQASSSAREAVADAVFPWTLGPMPMLEGFREGRHFGIHPQWGIAVLILLPAVLSVVPAAVALLHPTRR